jgi:hypothetical protein
MSKYVLASIGPASYEEIHTGTLDLRTARGRTKGAMMDQHRRHAASSCRRHPHVNPMGSKGIGEIGIVGSPAAVANAVYHATGVRVRDLPITPDKLVR